MTNLVSSAQSVISTNTDLTLPMRALQKTLTAAAEAEEHAAALPPAQSCRTKPKHVSPLTSSTAGTGQELAAALPAAALCLEEPSRPADPRGQALGRRFPPSPRCSPAGTQAEQCGRARAVGAEDAEHARRLPLLQGTDLT